MPDPDLQTRYQLLAEEKRRIETERDELLANNAIDLVFTGLDKVTRVVRPFRNCIGFRGPDAVTVFVWFGADGRLKTDTKPPEPVS